MRMDIQQITTFAQRDAIKGNNSTWYPNDPVGDGTRPTICPHKESGDCCYIDRSWRIFSEQLKYQPLLPIYYDVQSRVGNMR